MRSRLISFLITQLAGCGGLCSRVRRWQCLPPMVAPCPRREDLQEDLLVIPGLLAPWELVLLPIPADTAGMKG